MELIDKSAVVAEIKERQKRNQLDCTPEGSGAFYEDGFIIDLINSLEVKEVDLDLEISLWAHELYEIPYDDVGRMAKYFFELGLKAKGVEGICKISETNCPNFDEAQGTNFVRK